MENYLQERGALVYKCLHVRRGRYGAYLVSVLCLLVENLCT